MRGLVGGGPPLRLWLAAGAAYLSGCACKCTEDRPYTPFHIAAAPSAQPSPTNADAAPPGTAARPPFPRVATPAPPDSSDWIVDGLAIGVDKTRKFDRAITADFDGDGAVDAVAWTRARSEPPEAQSSGELVFFGKTAPAGRVLSKTPTFLPGGPGCRHTLDLAQTGPRTVTLDIRAHCDAALVPRSPTRGIEVIAPAAERVEVIGLQIADPAPGESLDFAVDSSDRDGDGRDDVRVSATMKSAPDDAGATANLVWLDRAAGPSRDAGEPAHSLAKTATCDAVRAVGKRKGDKFPPQIDDARRLYATLCAESGTARVFDADGAPLTCRDTAEALAELETAEVRASIAQRDPLAAAAALGRDDWFDAPLVGKRKRGLERQLLGIAPRRAVSELTLDVVPRPRNGLPRFSPLTFDADGSLLVEAADRVRRVHFPDGKVGAGDDATVAWPLTVGTGADPRWMGVAFPCDRSEVTLLLSDGAGAPMPSRPTTILAPRPGSCGRARDVAAVNLAPLEWSSVRQAGMVGGGLVGVSSISELGSVVAPGSPRSPDGRILVAPTTLGLLVLNRGRAEMWSASDPGTLSDCVVANGGDAAACIRGTRAVAFTPAAAVAKK